MKYGFAVTHTRLGSAVSRGESVSWDDMWDERRAAERRASERAQGVVSPSPSRPLTLYGPRDAGRRRRTFYFIFTISSHT